MEYLIAVLAGIAGTALMTGALYMLTYVTGRTFKVVKVLGNMLTNSVHADGSLSDNKRAIFLGVVAHYAIGVMFALIYVWLWQRGIGRPDLWNGIVFGTLNGLFAIVFWYMFITLHIKPPRLPMPAYLLAIGAGHILFSLGTVLVFTLI
jgi:uncharacterized membrane protein YagU involved in acid resistance